MWIFHPSRYYLLYRLSRNSDQLDDILTDFRRMRLAVPKSVRDLDDLIRNVIEFRREEFRVPSGFNPASKPLNRQTLDFLKKWKIHGAWLNDDATSKAFDLLHEPMIRHPLEVMLLGPITPTAIAQRLRDRHGLPESFMNAATVRAYSHYFWNYSVLSVPQWDNVIRFWMPDEQAERSVMLAALYSQRTPAGAAFVLSLADGGLENMPPSELFDSARAAGYRMFMQHAMLGTPGLSRTQGALAAFQIMQMASDMADRYRGGDTDLIKEFDRIQQRYDTARPRTMHDLPIVREQHMLPAAVVDSTAEETETEPTT